MAINTTPPPIDISQTITSDRLAAIAAVDRRDRRSIIGLVLAALTLVVVLVAVSTRSAVQSAAVSFRPITYQSQTICSGDPLPFDVFLTVLRAPAIVGFPYSVWDVKTGQTISSGVEPLAPIFLDSDVGREITVTQSYVDSNLAPGDYEYRRIARVADSVVTYFVIPFTVETCP